MYTELGLLFVYEYKCQEILLYVDWSSL